MDDNGQVLAGQEARPNEAKLLGPWLESWAFGMRLTTLDDRMIG